jgi:hypothetical protein
MSAGFVSPLHRFLRGLLDYYKIELQHLNPKGIQHNAAFVALCEGYLGIKPHFDLWRHFFAVNPQKKGGKGRWDLMSLMGCTCIHLWNNQSSEYMSLKLSTSNKGWHSQWFYLKNDAVAALSEFIRRIIEEAPPSWVWGVLEKDKKNIDDHRPAIRILKGERRHRGVPR